MDNKDKEALLSYVKVTHVCFIITLVCCLLSLTTIFFRTFFDIPVDFLEEYGIELDFFSILYLFEPSVTQVLGIEWTAKKYRTPLIPGEEVPTEWKRQDEDNLKKFNNNLILLLFFKIMACFLLPLALLGFHFSFWGYIYFCAGFYGYMYNVGFISDLISTIMIILLIIGLTADKRKEAAENRAERKALLKEENERSWREEFTTKILSQVGKNFFIKYYYSLKNWETPDIIDIIEEEYSENSKITRINNAKKLFEHNLEIFALEKIISSPTVKTDIKNIAQTIFDEEKSAISHSN